MKKQQEKKEMKEKLNQKFKEENSLEDKEQLNQRDQEDIDL